MLLAAFCSNYQKVFELVLAGEKKQYKKYSIFVNNADVSEKWEGKVFVVETFKLHKVLSICAKLQVFGIPPSEIK